MSGDEHHNDESQARKRARLSPSSNSNGHPLPPLSLSILGVEPLDEFIHEIADFVHHMIMTRPEHLGGSVEVEAKIGVLKDKQSGMRLQFPVLVETILAPDSIPSRFESNMSAAQHKHFNTLLNKLKVDPPQTASEISYTHRYLVDSFYPPAHPGEREKIRVTRDEKTGTVLECTQKIRLGDLNIYSPKRAADWRISVNLEVPVAPPTGTATHTRRKDRLSYSHEEFNIDLTQVTSNTSPNGPPELLHELEVEIARPEFLLAAAMRRGDPQAPEHERNAFDELIRAFVNNTRILLRNTGGDGF
ncbi:mRNA capping enzyme [Punctularia strigosozonata HHB-11173 SS5]|uniref:mRNA capping enzyme n=1 Tax=Punctularia strigosozonata (strain HHB-11173) TaxID=741275 RepID=UPI0004416814|nr:mRNA capping enzyme [Punctularia strigosozonata HHB-11173 SS5]EIN12927.1 mRNA capping enzyme [Punctularia strigosozonata HHB-11173 SS5]